MTSPHIPVQTPSVQSVQPVRASAKSLGRRFRTGGLVAVLTSVALTGIGVSTVGAVGPTLPSGPATTKPAGATPPASDTGTGGKKSSGTSSKKTTKSSGKAATKSPAKSKTTSNAKRVPLFLISSSPAKRRIGPGDNTTTQVNLQRSKGFSGSVTITASGTPKGVTLSFPPRIREFAPVTIETTPETKQGTYRITFAATNGPKRATSTFTLVIDDAYKGTDTGDTLPPIEGPTTSGTGAAPADQATTTQPAPSTTTTTPGLVRSLGSTTIAGLPGVATTAAAPIAGDFSLAFQSSRIVVAAAGTTTFGINILSAATPPAQPLSVLSGLPLGCTSVIGAITAGVLKVSVTCPATQPATTATLTITGTADGKSRTATTELQIVADMGISIAPSTITVAPGAAAQSSIIVANVATFTAPVALSIAGLPAGVAPTVAAQSLNNTSTVLTLTVAATVPVGTYPFTISGTGGGLTRTATGSLIVSTTPAPTVVPATTGSITPTPAASTLPPSTVTGVNNAEMTLTVTPVTNTTTVNGGRVVYTVSVSGTAVTTNGGAVISVAGLPTNATMTLTPNPTSSTSTLTITSSLPGSVATFAVTVTATSGAVSRSQVVQFILT